MRSILTLCAVLLSLNLALAQAPSSKPLSPFDQELANAETQLIQAMQQRNTAYVNSAVSEDFNGIGNNGDFIGRDEMVQEGLPKDSRLYDLRVIRLTDTSAVVAYNLIVPGARVRYRHMSDSWAKEGGQWKLKFQQTTPNLWSALDLD